MNRGYANEVEVYRRRERELEIKIDSLERKYPLSVYEELTSQLKALQNEIEQLRAGSDLRVKEIVRERREIKSGALVQEVKETGNKILEILDGVYRPYALKDLLDEMAVNFYGNIPVKDFLSGKEIVDGLAIGNIHFTPQKKELFKEAFVTNESYEKLIDSFVEKWNQKFKEIEEFINRNSIHLPLLDVTRINQKINRKKIKRIRDKKVEYRSKFIKDSHANFPNQREQKEIQEALSVYKKELFEKFFPADFFLKGFEALIPFGARQKHTYILGSSGSGKTELLKQFVFHDLKRKNGLLVLDPHGDLVKQCNRFDQDSSETIYISAEFGSKGVFPCYNPLEHHYHGKPHYEKQSYISNRTNELKGAFMNILGTEFTHNMERLINNCLPILLNKRGSTFADFLDFMRPQTSAPYEALGRDYPMATISDFFRYEFGTDHFRPTRQAVLTRFSNAFANYNLSKILTARKSSFDIKRLLDQGKCILVNLSQDDFGEEGSRILGSFLISEITTHALSRQRLPEEERRPIFVYIDECQNFLTDRMDKILSEGRKYGIHLTMANQYLGQFDQNRQLLKSVLANTAVKFCGKASYDDMVKMGKSIGMDITAIPDLRQGKFAVKVDEYSPLELQTYDFLVDTKTSYYLHGQRYEQKLRAQVKKYYRHVPIEQGRPSNPLNKDLPQSEGQKGDHTPKINKLR